MENRNRVSFELTAAQIDAIKAAIQTIKDQMPHLISLTPEEKQEMLKMGDGNLPFVLKACDYVRENPDNVPPFLQPAELQMDAKTHDDLEDIERLMLELASMITDTRFAAGSEMYYTSLIYYRYMGHASKIGVPGAKLIYADLKKRFTRSSSKPTEQAAE